MERMERTGRGAGRGNRANEPGIDPATELPPPDDEAVLSPAGAEAAEAEVQTGPTELEQLKAERDQLLDRLARLQAEFENARKRAEREKNEFRDYATGNVVEQFLPVLDNFELALKSKGSAEQLRSGVELDREADGRDSGQDAGERGADGGREFDPRVHEALGTVERDDIPDQHVAEEIRRGYKTARAAAAAGAGARGAQCETGGGVNQQVTRD